MSDTNKIITEKAINNDGCLTIFLILTLGTLISTFVVSHNLISQYISMCGGG